MIWNKEWLIAVGKGWAETLHGAQLLSLVQDVGRYHR